MIITKDENKQLNWFGYIMRMKNDRLVKKVNEAGIDEQKKTGRPRERSIDRVKEIGDKKW